MSRLRKEAVRALINRFGQTYSGELGINLKAGSDREIFKWFLCALLFGAPIGETSAKNTYKKFEQNHLLTPEKILEAGWDTLVSVLDEGGYVRYDFKTADKLLEVAGNLKKKYGGSLNRLHEEASNPRDLEERLVRLGKGVGPTTVNIFLREMTAIWDKASPLPQSLEVTAARNLGLTRYEGKDEDERRRVLKELLEAWREQDTRGKPFSILETALVRLAKDYCRKGKCNLCGLKGYCVKPPTEQTSSKSSVSSSLGSRISL